MMLTTPRDAREQILALADVIEAQAEHIRTCKVRCCALSDAPILDKITARLRRIVEKP